MRPLGEKQLERLIGLADPGILLVRGDDRVTQSLVARGLLRSRKPGLRNIFLQITPAGLRALADAFEAGRLERFFKYPKGIA